MPLQQLRIYRERTGQNRNALHMLALSGVVRPSHVELRYTIPTIEPPVKIFRADFVNVYPRASVLHLRPYLNCSAVR